TASSSTATAATCSSTTTRRERQRSSPVSAPSTRSSWQSVEMGAFSVSPIDLAPITGVHRGTGTFQDSIWLVVPASVPPPGRLAFFGKTVHVTTMLFEIADKVVPNWFGVAVPSGVEDFTRPHLFFHPTPAQAGYIDSQYPTKAGKW